MGMEVFGGSVDIPSCCWVGNPDTDVVCAFWRVGERATLWDTLDGIILFLKYNGLN